MKSFFPGNLSSLSDESLHRAHRAAARTLCQVQEDLQRIRAELEKREAAERATKQAACKHPDGFSGFIYGFCPHCGLEGG